MSIADTHVELNKAWTGSYSAKRNESAVDSISDKPIDHRIMHLITRLFFRGIYFPQMRKRAWLKLVVENRRPICKLAKEGIDNWRAAGRNRVSLNSTNNIRNVRV